MLRLWFRAPDATHMASGQGARNPTSHLIAARRICQVGASFWEDKQMKLRATLAAIAVVCAVPAFAQDAVLGTYKTQPDDNGKFGHVEIYACDAMVCGVIRKAFDGSGNETESANIGKRMLWNMSADGGGKYSGGKIWAPDRDKVYSSKMELSGVVLEVSGCVFGICRAQTWTKIN